MIKFELDDVESYKLEFDNKFYLTEREKRQNLRTGDIVKLIFRFEDDEFARTRLNRTSAIGEVQREKLNVLGGSLAYGNPRAVTGLRILIQALFELKRRDKSLALVATSGLGGLGAAMILERE